MKKVKIIAEDNIGRTEHICLVLKENIVDELMAAYNHKTPEGMPDSLLSGRLSELYDNYNYGYREISYSQFRKLRNFYDLIYNKFYNYKLHITMA